MIRAGAMRHLVEFRRRTEERDSAGEPLGTWTTVATRRCAVRRTPGSEVWGAAQRSARVPVVLELRYLDGITADMRAVLDGRVLNIISAVDQAGLQEELVVTAEELDGVTA